MLCEGYEVNCCAVAMHREAWCSAVAEHGGAAALRSTDRQGRVERSKDKALISLAMEWRSEEMRGTARALHRQDTTGNGKATKRPAPQRQGFASDALAWKREEMP